jgi:hypothetical protein
LESCAQCGKQVRRDDPVTAIFATDGTKRYYHKTCDEKTDQFAKWKEEAQWAFRPTRLTIAEWTNCSPKKHLGVWQSMFIARRDDDVWCPDCGLKIARHEHTRCTKCGSPAAVLAAEPARMVFTHREPLFRLLLHCTQNGEESIAYAITSGFTVVAFTPKKGVAEVRGSDQQVSLRVEPKGDPNRGLRVG